MQIRRLISTFIISSLLIQNSLVSLAYEDVNNDIHNTTYNKYVIPFKNMKVETDINDTNIENIISTVPDINEQLDELYTNIGDRLGVDKLYIKKLHWLAGGKAIYAEKKPDIINDITTESLRAPMEIDGAKTKYIKADFINCKDSNIERSSKYYLPDAIYSVSYEVISLMSQRYYYNRGGYQTYFDSLLENVKKDISFYEAVMLYTGVSEETVNRFFTAYEKILYDKEANENVVEEKNGEYIIKEKFTGILHDIGIKSDTNMKLLAKLLSFDENLAVNDNLEVLQNVYNLPYKTNFTSRENMMIAAASLCGKVRYVWGGGHSGASYIDGINPIWQKFEELYPDTKTTEIENEDGDIVLVDNEGFGTCIKPSGSWCPIHGSTHAEYHGGTVTSLQEYVDLSAERMDASELLSTKYVKMLSKVNYNNGINVHTLDGLDCSGFASWLYNQITDKYEINSTAWNFTKQSGLVPIEYGDKTYPGDIFAWTRHIVIIVGKVNDNEKAFVTIEQTPNMLKYGVIYYSDAASEDIELAKKIASEANQLIGGIDPELEKPHVYCMDSVGMYTVTETVNTTEETENSTFSTVDVWFPESNVEGYDPNEYIPSNYDHYDYLEDEDGYILRYYIEQAESSEETVETVVEHQEQYREIGRFADNFLDEEINIEEYKKPIKEMYAQEIIQHTINKLPISYITGYNDYNGDIFDKSNVATKLGVEIS